MVRPRRRKGRRRPRYVDTRGARGMPIVVKRVSDGDTVVVHEDRRFAPQFRVRLYGIDAPESDQPFGRESTEALRRILMSQPVALDVFAHDRYGRAVGLLYPRGGDPRRSVNVEMVREGWAYCYHRNGRYSQGLNAAQREARAAARGVWAQPTERPWAHRRRMAEEPAAAAMSIGSRIFLGVLALAVLLIVIARVGGG